MLKILSAICIFCFCLCNVSAKAELSNITKELFRAVTENNLEKVQASLSAGANMNALNVDGETPAGIAVNMGYFEIAHFILLSRKRYEIRDQSISNKSQEIASSDKVSTIFQSPSIVRGKSLDNLATLAPEITTIKSKTPLGSKKLSIKSPNQTSFPVTKSIQPIKPMSQMVKKEHRKYKILGGAGVKNSSKIVGNVEVKPSTQVSVLSSNDSLDSKQGKDFFSTLKKIFLSFSTTETVLSNANNKSERRQNKIISKPRVPILAQLELAKSIPVENNLRNKKKTPLATGIITLGHVQAIQLTNNVSEDAVIKRKINPSPNKIFINRETKLLKDKTFQTSLKTYQNDQIKVLGKPGNLRTAGPTYSAYNINSLIKDFKLGQKLSSKKSDLRNCFQKFEKKTWYCLKNVTLPKFLLTNFKTVNASDQTPPAIVRYNDGVAVRMLVNFPSTNFLPILKILELKLGGSTSKIKRILNIVPGLDENPVFQLPLDIFFGQSKPQFNSIVRWDDVKSDLTSSPVVELIQYDDIKRDVMNLNQGLLRLYYKNTLPIFHYISGSDIAQHQSKVSGHLR